MSDYVTRRAVLTAVLTILTGCLGTEPEPTTSGPANPALGPVTRTGGLELTSPAFGDGEAIPRKYGRAYRNRNPPLVITGTPAAAESLTLIMEDPDAPGGTFLHWLVWNLPPDTRRLPKGEAPESGTVGRNDFGNRRYDGPQPPSGTHTYRFKCYALSRRLDLPADATRAEVGDAMTGAVLGSDQLTGEYSADA